MWVSLGLGVCCRGSSSATRPSLIYYTQHRASSRPGSLAQDPGAQAGQLSGCMVCVPPQREALRAPLEALCHDHGQSPTGLQVALECTETCTSTDHPHSRQALAPSSGLGDTSTGTPAWALKIRIHVKGTGSAWLCQGQANNRKGHDALGSHTADHHWTACRAERQGGQGSPEAGLGAAGE